MNYSSSGIEETIRFNVGRHPVRIRFEVGRSKEDKISAVQYVRFHFDDQALQTFLSGARSELVIDHQNYKAVVVLQPETQRSLAADLTG
jgi:hypothetical protein